MDVELLRTFLEVYHTRHFGQAADNLFVSQSSVSARIRLLEDTIGTPLFTRARNNIQVTPAGQRLLRYAESIVTTWNRARQEVASAQDFTPLSIGGVPSMWDIALQDWIYAVYENFGDIALHGEALGVDTIVRRLQDGTLDLGFTFESPQNAGLVAREIMSVPLIMVSSRPGLTVPVAIREHYVLVDWGTSFSISHAQHFPDLPPPRIRFSLGRLARDLLLKCGGTAYLAEPMVSQLFENGVLHRVEDAPVIQRSAYALYPVAYDRVELIGRILSLFGSPEAP